MFSALGTKIVERTRHRHGLVRKTVFRIAQSIFNNPISLDTRQRMFHANPYLRNLPIALLILTRQLLPARLFFGW